MAFALRTICRAISRQHSVRSASRLALSCFSNAQTTTPLSSSSKNELQSLLSSAPRVLAHHRLMSTEDISVDDVTERVMSCLKLYDKINQENLTADCHFMKDLGLDSLDHVEIIVAIENEFSLELPDDVAETLLTPNDVIKCVIERLDISSS